MTLIKNFEQFVNENLEQKFKVFEDIDLGGELSYPSNDVATGEFTTWLNTPAAAEFRTFAAMQNTSGNRLSIKENQASILFALLKRGQATKKGRLGFGSITDDDLAKKGFDGLKSGTLKLTVSQAMVDYTPKSEAEYSSVRTAGRFNTSTQLLTDPKFNQTASTVLNIVMFVNEYNTQAFAKGQAQYVISKRMREDGYLDFLSAAEVVDNVNLYLYASKIKGTDAAAKTVTPTEVGGEPGSVGKYGAEFVVGSAEVNTTVAAEVAKAADFIATRFPAGKVPDKFQLTSGASTEWGKPAVNYPQTSGSGPVANPTTDEQKNQDLAYRRGVAFANALNTKLKEKGHPGIDGFVVNWSIGKSGQQANPADRFIDLEVEKNAAAPVKQTSMQVSQTGSNSQINSATKGQIYEFKLTITEAAAAAPQQ